MNEFEQEERPLFPSENTENMETDAEASLIEEPVPNDGESADTPMPVIVKRAPRKKFRTGPSETKRFNRFVAIAWSGAREPAADLIWAEAHLDGKWVVIDALDKIRTRKEILERILDLQAALVTLDFNFSYPTTFFDLLRETESIVDWHTMLRTIRSDVKKNVDDGLRLWAERMGRYRESQLDPDMPRGKLQHTRRYDDWGWNSSQKGLAPHEQLSLARRFRHTDLPLSKIAGIDLMSTMQIGYNRLTSRYEFNGNIRGRPALLGMAMLEQLLEVGRKDLSIWPMMEPRALTIAESLPWLFTEGKVPEIAELENVFNNYEDAGWEIPNSVRAYARKNNDARKALFTLIGVVKTEERLAGRRGHPPIRDYNHAIYRDPRVQLEGWIYGVGYRPPEGMDSGANHSRRERPGRESSPAEMERNEPTTNDTSVAEPVIEE